MQQQHQEAPWKVVFLGTRNSGKTSYARRLFEQEFRTVKYAPGEEEPTAPTRIRAPATNLPNGKSVLTEVWDYASDLFDKAEEGEVRTALIGARAIVYFVSDARQIDEIEELQRIVRRSDDWTRRFADRRCVYALFVNQKLHRGLDLVQHAAQAEAGKLGAFVWLIDIQQNVGVTESWFELLGCIYYRALGDALGSSALAATSARPRRSADALVIRDRDEDEEDALFYRLPCRARYFYKCIACCCCLGAR